jgi:hypothetical protein
MRPLLLFAITAFVLSANCACAKDNVVPVMVPIDSQWIAKPMEVKFTIKDRVNYAINMDFFLTEPSRISHFFDKHSYEQSRRLWLALGGEIIDGRSNDRGFPGDIHVQVKNRNGETVHEQTVVKPKTHARYMGRYTYLTVLNNLPPNT